MSYYQTPLKTVSLNSQPNYTYLTPACDQAELPESASMKPQLNIFGLLCYTLGWISGLIMLGIRHRDSLVRFHAWQSLITFGLATIPLVVMNLLTVTSPVLYWFLIIFYWLIIAVTLYIWILLMIKAYQGQAYQLSFAGVIASRLSKEGNRSAFVDTKARYLSWEDNIGIKGVIATEPERKALHYNENSRGMLTEMITSIATLCQTRDPYTASHQQRVAHLACAIARKMGFSTDRIEGIRIMGIVHDIGKIAVPAEILSKPGRLNNYEFGLIKTHPQVAYDIVKGMEFPWPVAQAIFQHHERMDGSGYPSGLAGEEVIWEARILAIADTVEAMASHRPYRPAMGIDKALSEISQNRGILYDAAVVDACLGLFARKEFAFL
ncbi:HD domain-containing phosphohydrolase [Chloroflexota bacterium]